MTAQKIITNHRRLLGTIGAIAAVIIATVYFFIVPEKATSANGATKLLLLYGHSTCWILIASASLLWAVKGTSRLSAGLLYGALVVYIGFLAAMTLSPPLAPTNTINNYRACERAGGRIAESYPTQCFIDGKSFVNDAQQATN